MFSVVLVIHLIITVALVGIILLQRSEAGGLGVGGSGNIGAMAPRGQADVLSRATGWLAAIFFITSLTLVILGVRGGENASLVNQLQATTPAQTPLQGPDGPLQTSGAPATPGGPTPITAPAAPSVPLAK